LHRKERKQMSIIDYTENHDDGTPAWILYQGEWRSTPTLEELKTMKDTDNYRDVDVTPCEREDLLSWPTVINYEKRGKAQIDHVTGKCLIPKTEMTFTRLTEQIAAAEHSLSYAEVEMLAAAAVVEVWAKSSFVKTEQKALSLHCEKTRRFDFQTRWLTYLRNLIPKYTEIVPLIRTEGETK